MIDSLIAQLARRRRAAGITQHQLAAALHCTRTAFVNWESGRYEPPLPMLRRWAELLDAPLVLLTLDEDGEGDHDPEIPGQLRTPEQRRRRVLELARDHRDVPGIAARVGVSERTVYRLLADA